MENGNELTVLESKPEIKKFEVSISELVSRAEELEIADESTLACGVEIQSQISFALKSAETQRTEWTGPINKSLDSINGFFKKLVAPLKEAKESTNKKVMDYRQEQQRIAAVAAEKARKEVEAANRQAALEAEKTGKPAPVPIPVVIPTAPTSNVKTDSGSMSFRKDWKHLVVDPAQVPREYLVVDDKLIRSAIADGIRKIPGVNIFQVETPITRS